MNINFIENIGNIINNFRKNINQEKSTEQTKPEEKKDENFSPKENTAFQEDFNLIIAPEEQNYLRQINNYGDYLEIIPKQEEEIKELTVRAEVTETHKEDNPTPEELEKPNLKAIGTKEEPAAKRMRKLAEREALYESQRAKDAEMNPPEKTQNSEETPQPEEKEDSDNEPQGKEFDVTA